MTQSPSWFDGSRGFPGDGHGRSVNRLRILQAVRTHGPISRADLAKHSRLSPPTVSTVVDELATGLGLVRDRGPGVSRGGRRPILVEFNAEYGFLAGVDLGSRAVRAGICDLQGRVLARRQEPTRTESRQGTLGQVVGILRRVIDESGLDPGKLFAIGIGAPGMTDVEAGRVISAVNLPGFEDVPLRDVLEEAFGVPTAVDNDANMAALGERWQGCARGRADFVFLAWGAGVGAGLVIGGRLHRGSRWFAGEISHMHLDFRDWARDYGAQGFLESRVGASALPRLLSAEGAGRSLPPAALFEAAADGDPRAQALVDAVVVYLGTTVANITAVLDPSLVVFGGGLSCAGEHLMRRIEQVAARIVPNVPEIRLTALGDEAQLYGSLYSALQLGERRLEALVTGRAGALA